MLLVGMESGATILENSLAVPQIIKYRVIPKKMKTYIHTKNLYKNGYNRIYSQKSEIT